LQSEWKELVSASNCTDYQTRELDVRYGTPVKKGKDEGKEEGTERKQYVHALKAVSDQFPTRIEEGEEANVLGC
jgi:seryl-tRNA synthetase